MIGPDTPYGPDRRVLDRREAAATLRRLRLGAIAFVAVQFSLYAPGPEAGPLPFARWPVAGAIVLALLATNALSVRWARSDDADALLRAARAEVLVDATLTLVVMTLFSFDEDVRLWPLLAVPILEAAMRLGFRDTMLVWAYGSLGYVVDQVIRMPTRSDPAGWVAALPFAAGILLMIAGVSGLLSRRVQDEVDLAAERTRELQMTSAALRMARDDAEDANEAKNEFLSRMSHELRTPMNSVLGFAQLVQLDEGLSDDSREGLDHILTAGHHLLGLIDQVLEISRIESRQTTVSVEDVSLYEAVVEAADLLRPVAAQRGISITLDLPTDTVVRADLQRLKQVLLNVMGNAVKFNRDDGRVHVRADREEGTDRVRLAVEDDGPGIPPGSRERVFSPFDRLEATSAVPGSGLGLAVSQRLMKAMGGRLDYDEDHRGGALFWLALEVVDATGGAVKAPRRRIDPEPIQLRGRVLYIEDNAANLRLVERLLDRLPEVELLSAMQGRLGIAMAREHRPDLVLLDLHLPDLDGAEVLARLRDDPATAQVPVVVLSADATDRNRRSLLAAGADAYLTKPLDIPTFTETVRRLMGIRATSTPPSEE